jgi:hypothetical protein
MDVPIEYTNTFPSFTSSSGSNSNVIEKAKASWLLALCMVTWRPNYTIAPVEWRLFVKNLV